MDKLISRFTNVVTLRGSAAAEAAEGEAMEEDGAADAGCAGLEELIARFVDVRVRDDAPAPGEAACAVRVRLPDGRVFDRVFGATRPVAALFRYCAAAVAACGMPGRPIRLLRFAGGASDEIPDREDVSLQDLRLDRCVLYVVFSP